MILQYQYLAVRVNKKGFRGFGVTLTDATMSRYKTSSRLHSGNLSV
jgi:hypothetical protein